MLRDDAIALAVKNPAFVSRFKLKSSESGGCLRWMRRKDRDGYGLVDLPRDPGAKRSVFVRAHRVAWSISNGRIPDGMCVCHRCDNPGCVLADHLFLGTNADNMADKVSKERHARGESSGASRFTEKEVLWIRFAAFMGMKQSDLERLFGTSQCAINSVVHGYTWRHLKLLVPLSPVVDTIGEGHGCAKLRSCDVLEIRKMLARGVAHREVARRFCVSKSSVTRISAGQAWTHI